MFQKIRAKWNPKKNPTQTIFLRKYVRPMFTKKKRKNSSRSKPLD